MHHALAHGPHSAGGDNAGKAETMPGRPSSASSSRSTPPPRQVTRADPNSATPPPPLSSVALTGALGRERAKPTRTAPSGRVRVLVRCRPLLPMEEGHLASRIHTTNTTVVVNDSDGARDARQYTFDAVLPPAADQASVFEEVEPLIEHVLDGLHATVFAYGQTGSGKTYTMEGLSRSRAPRGGLGGAGSGQVGSSTASPGGDAGNGGDVPGPADDIDAPADAHGIMPRAIQLLFDRARVRQGGESGPTTSEPDEAAVTYTFRCSFYQIYNEVVTDLLNTSTAARAPARYRASKTSCTRPTDGLKVRCGRDGTFRVQNLFLCECESAEQMRNALFAGVQQKAMGSHRMNDQSSRSHCVFTIYVECRKARTGDVVSRAELSLVDLAGSEKLSLLAANPSAQLMKESIEINTSLLALGKVITALATASQKHARLTAKRQAAGRGSAAGSRAALAAAAAAGHVPYRDSKLTMLLKHALGGNSLTIMIACISSSDRYVEESVSTLLYAGRARNIENVPHINEDPVAALIKQLRAEIAQLKDELRRYRELAGMELLRAGGTDSAPRERMRGDQGGQHEASAPVASVALGPRAREQLQEQADNLADALTSACAMLQQVLAANGQLRDAYDVVRAATDAAAVREVQLNAENLALRERIQALESIVLTRDTEDAEGDLDEEQGGSEQDREEEQVSSRSAMTHTSMQAIRERSDHADGRGPAPAVVRATETSALPAAAVNAAGNGGSRKPPMPRPRAPAVATERFGDLVEGGDPPSRERRPARREASTDPAGGGRRADRRRDRKVHRDRKKLARRLEEYEKHYRGGGGVADASTWAGDVAGSRGSYAQYYGRAAKKATLAESAGEPAATGATAARRELLATRSDMQQAVVKTVVEVQALVRKLPEELVGDVVPQSLRHTRTFGALAFGGGPAETAPFEANRQSREARRAALLERQSELRALVQTDITERRFHTPPPAPWAEAAASTGEGLGGQHSVDTAEAAANDLFAKERRGNGVAVVVPPREGSSRQTSVGATQPPRREWAATPSGVDPRRRAPGTPQPHRGRDEPSPYTTALFTKAPALPPRAPSNANPPAPSLRNADKQSSMDKLLQYLREQGV